jgi:hypothetical protein
MVRQNQFFTTRLHKLRFRTAGHITAQVIVDSKLKVQVRYDGELQSTTQCQ